MDTLLFEKEIEGLGKIKLMQRGECVWITVPSEDSIFCNMGWVAIERKDGRVEYTAVNSQYSS